MLRPLALASVAIALGASLYAGDRLSRRLAAHLPEHGSLALALGLALGGWLTVTPLFARAFSSFDAGLVSAAVVAGVVAFFCRRLEVQGPRAWRSEARLVPALLLVTLVYGYLSWRYQMHDEHAIFGHKSMVEQLRRGLYPIHLPPLPLEEARYHVGFDVLAGALTRALDVSSDAAIDVATVASALMISVSAAALVSAAGASRVAPFAAVAVHLGAGLAFAMLAGVEGRHPRCLVQYHHPSCGVELFPTPLLNVFQHPVSIGVPLLFTWLLLARALVTASGRDRWLILAGGVALLPGLAIGQVVYFALGVLAVLAALSFGVLVGPDRKSSALVISAVLGVTALSMILGRLSGGMFAPTDVIDPNLVRLRTSLGFPAGYDALQVLHHHVVNLGVGFLLFPFFVFVAVRRRDFTVLSLVAFSTGGMLVPHLWTYTRSWDIVKFPSAAAFVLTLLYVILVDAALLRRSPIWRWPRRLGRGLLVGGGVLAIAFLAWPLPQHLRLYDPTHHEVDPVIARTIAWWDEHDYDHRELVVAQANVARQLAVFGGMSVVGSDYDFQALGVKSEELMRQRSLSRQVVRNLDRRALEALGVGWLMFSEEELRNLGPAARPLLTTSPPAWLERVASFETDPPRRTRHIWRVHADAP